MARLFKERPPESYRPFVSGGRTYRPKGFYTFKKNAEFVAGELRKAGYLARVKESRRQAAVGLPFHIVYVVYRARKGRG
ncbi:hypothetical protein LCGC14_1247110 [marine sediment metagenome]|uniref:Uncharacterized protein n=1 Tax=marine sediment metagenome TaxID=412755 RepID=A0A0F9NLE2_9ZZZZ